MNIATRNIIIYSIVKYLKKNNYEKERFAYILKNKNIIINTNIEYFLNNTKLTNIQKVF